MNANSISVNYSILNLQFGPGLKRASIFTTFKTHMAHCFFSLFCLRNAQFYKATRVNLLDYAYLKEVIHHSTKFLGSSLLINILGLVLMDSLRNYLVQEIRLLSLK